MVQYSQILASQVAQWQRIFLAMQEMWVWSLGWEDLPEEEMATVSSILHLENPMDRGGWWAADMTERAHCFSVHGHGIAVTMGSEESGPPYLGRANNIILPWVITLPPALPWEHCHWNSPPRWHWTLKLPDSCFCPSRRRFHFHLWFIEIACAIVCPVSVSLSSAHCWNIAKWW